MRNTTSLYKSTYNIMKQSGKKFYQKNLEVPMYFFNFKDHGVYSNHIDTTTYLIFSYDNKLHLSSNNLSDRCNENNNDMECISV